MSDNGNLPMSIALCRTAIFTCPSFCLPTAYNFLFSLLEMRFKKRRAPAISDRFLSFPRRLDPKEADLSHNILLAIRARVYMIRNSTIKVIGHTRHPPE
jgi:hypothetical protein